MTKYQLEVLNILSNGGDIFLFEDGSTGLDDNDGNTLKFRGTTFNSLIKNGMIEIKLRPVIGVEIYGLSLKGKSNLLIT
jgi:hypothetical protein